MGIVYVKDNVTATSGGTDEKGNFKRRQGSAEVTTERSLAKDVGTSARAFATACNSVEFAVFYDITDNKGYEEWATRTNRILREKADKCLVSVEEIKREYREAPKSVKYTFTKTLGGIIPVTSYQVVWLTSEDELTFIVDPASMEGIRIEPLLKSDFRLLLDNMNKMKIKSGGGSGR